ncbi:MAG: phosphoglycolate phosphatase [Pseudomonadota bacterium]
MPNWLCFDLDGTLVDSVPDVTFSINEMLQAFQFDQVEASLARNWVGNGADKLIERALVHTLGQMPEKNLFEQAKKLFFTAYQKNLAVKTTIYPGCVDVLKFFQLQNIPLGCVTNKPRQFTPPLLEKLDLAQYFSALVCGDDLATKKPDPEPLLEAIQQLGGKPNNGYMVGDSETDILAASRARTGAIYVSYGYNRGVSVEKYQPIYINVLTELQTLFNRDDVSTS